MQKAQKTGGATMPEKNRPNAERLRDDARSAAVAAEAERMHGDRGADSNRHRRRPLSWHRLKWALRIVLLLAILIAVLFLLPKVRSLFRPSVEFSVPESLSELMPDETMGYSSIDFSNAILGESREKSDFVRA
jgi:hypothetical protein